MAANYIHREGRRLETLSLKLLEIMVLKRREPALFKDVRDTFDTGAAYA